MVIADTEIAMAADCPWCDCVCLRSQGPQFSCGVPVASSTHLMARRFGRFLEDIGRNSSLK